LKGKSHFIVRHEAIMWIGMKAGNSFKKILK